MLGCSAHELYNIKCRFLCWCVRMQILIFSLIIQIYHQASHWRSIWIFTTAACLVIRNVTLTTNISACLRTLFRLIQTQNWILQVIRTFNLGIYVYKETRILIPKCGSLLICLWMIWMQIRIFNVSWQIMLVWFCFIGASVLLFYELVFCLFWLSRLPMHFLYLTSNHQKQSFLSDRVACRTVWYN